MTEAEWMACGDPHPMFVYLYQNPVPIPATNRKAILFAAACCARLQPLVRFRIAKRSVEWLETIVDSQPTLHDSEAISRSLQRAYNKSQDGRERAALNAIDGARSGIRISNFYVGVWQVALRASRAIAAGDQASEATEGFAQCDLLRDIFGNPFRPVSVDPAWLTSDVLALARGIYDDKAFDRMPILADALQDAGCADPDVLNHCRGDGPHVRGCWVVDLLLGKA